MAMADGDGDGDGDGADDDRDHANGVLPRVTIERGLAQPGEPDPNQAAPEQQASV